MCFQLWGSAAVKSLHQENDSRQAGRKWAKLTLIGNLALHTAQSTSRANVI